MSNGNDWRQQNHGQADGAGGGAGSPGGGGNQGGNGGVGGGARPPGGGAPTDMITEGWGGGPQVSVDEVIERAKLVFSRAKGPIMIAWILLGAVALVLDLIGAGIGVINYLADSLAASGLLAAISVMLGVVSNIVGAALAVLQLSLFKPLHRAIFENNPPQGGALDVIKEAAGVAVPVFVVMLVVGLGSGLGMACCLVPGLFAAVTFCQAPYLAATRKIGPMEALKRSLVLNKTYWKVILAGLGTLIVCGLFASCLISATGFVVGLGASILGPLGHMFTTAFFWGFIQLGWFASFLAYAAIFSTIESKETGRQPV